MSGKATPQVRAIELINESAYGFAFQSVGIDVVGDEIPYWAPHLVVFAPILAVGANIEFVVP